MKNPFLHLKAAINPHNISIFLYTFRVLKNPITFLFYYVLGSSPKKCFVRTPLGLLSVELINHESLRTVFSIFVRNDYFLSLINAVNTIDIGSNIGISALYFLTRNQYNKVICIEPDPENRLILLKNLELFKDRYFLISEACTPNHLGSLDFYISTDGKYSSLLQIKNYSRIISVKAIPIMLILEQASEMLPNSRFNLKIDIEGLEKEVLRAISAKELLNIDKIYIEALDLKDCLFGYWKTSVRAGYVTILENITNAQPHS